MSRAADRRLAIGLAILSDVAVIWLAFQLSSLSRLGTYHSFDYLVLLRDRAICVLIFLAAGAAIGTYKDRYVLDRFDAVYYMLVAWGVTCAVLISLIAVLPASLRAISRREILIGAALGGIALTVWRIQLVSVARALVSFHRHFAVVGPTDKASRIAAAINDQGNGYYSAAACPAAGTSGEALNLPDADAAIVTAETESPVELMSTLGECQRAYPNVYLYPAHHQLLLFHVHKLQAVAGIPIIEIAGQGAPPPYVRLKRVFDVVLSATGLCLASPIALAAAIAVKLTSPGPIIYRQERLGKNGVPFTIYKFRTMTAGVEVKDETGHVLATAGDSRITPIGAFLRKHRVDEIPQLFNVLKGDMAFIGPRPVWREFYDSNRDRLPLVDRRLDVRPGLTSLSHVLGSYSSEPEDRLLYDLAYISTLSFSTDLMVLLSTVRIVLSGKGAQ